MRSDDGGLVEADKMELLQGGHAAWTEKSDDHIRKAYAVNWETNKHKHSIRIQTCKVPIEESVSV